MTDTRIVPPWTNADCVDCGRVIELEGALCEECYGRRSAHAESEAEITELRRQLDRARELQRGAEAQCERAQQEREELRRRLHDLTERGNIEARLFVEETPQPDKAELARLRRIEAAARDWYATRPSCLDHANAANAATSETWAAVALAEAIGGDVEMICASGCGQTPHRWRPYPESGPGWRCSECGQVTEPQSAGAAPKDDPVSPSAVADEVGQTVAPQPDEAEARYTSEWYESCAKYSAQDALRRMADRDYDAAEVYLRNALECIDGARGKPAPQPDEADDGIEPGQPIGTASCPCCGAKLEIEHGDEPGEIAVVGECTEEIGRLSRVAFGSSPQSSPQTPPSSHPEADEWPLLCEQGPDDSEGKATYRLHPLPGARVFRCRRVPGSRAINNVVPDVVEDILQRIDDSLSTWCADDTFGDFEDRIVVDRDGAHEALKRWADEWIEVELFELGPEVE